MHLRRGSGGGGVWLSVKKGKETTLRDRQDGMCQNSRPWGPGCDGISVVPETCRDVKSQEVKEGLFGDMGQSVELRQHRAVYGETLFLSQGCCGKVT